MTPDEQKGNSAPPAPSKTARDRTKVTWICIGMGAFAWALGQCTGIHMFVFITRLFLVVKLMCAPLLCSLLIRSVPRVLLPLGWRMCATAKRKQQQQQPHKLPTPNENNGQQFDKPFNKRSKRSLV